MYIAYLDESGVPENANTSHFVLLGLAIRAEAWRGKDVSITDLKVRHRLGTAELHAGWMARRFSEQERIAGFDQMGETDRRAAVVKERRIDMRAAAARSRKAAMDLAKNHRKTEPYIHLTRAERMDALRDMADRIGTWDDAFIFADAQYKAASYPRITPEKIFDFAFMQVVTRFNTFLVNAGDFGMLVQDRNDTSADRLTYLMRSFHRDGTEWADEIKQIVETPLFVESALTSMVQLADICSYATRRFFENQETDLFDRIYPRFQRWNQKLVGLRHFTGKDHPCDCRVCIDHVR